MTPHAPITPPATLGEALRPIPDLSDSEFAAIISAISGPRSFSLTNDELGVLQKTIPSDRVNLPYFFGALAFLYSQITKAIEAGTSYDKAVVALTDELNEEAKWAEKKSIAQKRLERLLEKKESHQHFRKLERLQSGFLPNAISFASFVDLRPDFDGTEQLVVRGYMPMIQFRVTTDSNNPEFKRMIFQMNEEALAELKKALERAELKLEAIRQEAAVALKIAKI